MKGTHQYTLINIANRTDGCKGESALLEGGVVERYFAISKRAAKARDDYNGFIPFIGAALLGGATGVGAVLYSSPDSPWWAALAGVVGLAVGAVGGVNYALRKINALEVEKKETRSKAEQSLTQFQTEYEPHTLYDQLALRKALGV
jgi:hypothetical protein